MHLFDRAGLSSLFDEETKRFTDTHPESAARAEQAGRHLLAGVPMPWMARWPGPFPLVVEEADGARFRDVDGHEYVDLCLGDTGAMVGHAPAGLAETLATQARRGITTMLPSTDAMWVAEELHRRFGLPVWQMAMTATDANRFVLRFARHLTGRPKVLVVDWCYHGTVDESFATLDDAGRVHARPGSIGPAVDPALTTEVVQFNDLLALAAVLERREVACVLIEPAMTNIGIVLPDAGYHQALRDLCDRTGTLLVIDETHTICVGPGGATEAWGLRPDFFVIGKTIGSGVPAAAYGMTDSIAAQLLPAMDGTEIDTSGVGGTLTGNALALAAVRHTLANALLEDDFAHMIPLATAWTAGVQTHIDRVGFDWCVQQLGARAEYWFCPPPRNGRDAAAAVDAELDSYLHLFALNRGVLMTPFHNMALFSPAHRQADVDVHTAMFGEALDSLVSIAHRSSN